MKHFFSFLFFSIALSCNAQTPLRELRLDARHIVFLLDSADAAKTITYDRRDRYFELVTAGEMSIQMKKPLVSGQSRENLLAEYTGFLKSDVEGFSVADAEFTAGVMKKVFQTVNSVNPALFPDTLLLIKTKGRHYGDGVWYTRENCIVIPENELDARKTNAFTTTMYHELFHVWSRLHPEQSKKLYQLIGFEGIGLQKLKVPEKLAERVLYNPDGVDFAQKITLTTADNTQIQAVPVIYANHVGAKEGQNEFFGYLEFNLFRIEPEKDGAWGVVTKDDGFSSTLNLNELPDFFRQIKDNTGYIIHPDEVLADNFSFIMISVGNPTYTSKFSADGKKLLTDIERLLKAK
ncbi:MAG: hypothetical protein IPJ82_06655 [Lewinellaceae bacterium]|nr:hypothetical protein [Lewinellaceae bacterium]